MSGAARSDLDLCIDFAWWAMVTAPTMELRIARARQLLQLRKARAGR
jgi:hypothetical protein